jgi:hypothetical protein
MTFKGYNHAKRCVDCRGPARRRQQIQYTEANRDHLNARMRDWCARNAESQRAYKYNNHLVRKYGLTRDQYEALLAVQGGGCALCGAEHGGIRGAIRKVLAVDHDHSTGKIRGLLCSTCNTLVEAAADPAFMARATEYLASPPGEKVLAIAPKRKRGEAFEK